MSTDKNSCKPDRETLRTLSEEALQARSRSYAPYSRFSVGAALLCTDGKVYTGCNIENASYGAANCAERTAFFKAVSEGGRSFSAIAIAGGPEGKQAAAYCPPCGICRQVMREFCGPDFLVVLAAEQREPRVLTLAELLPESFGPDNLDRSGK